MFGILAAIVSVLEAVEASVKLNEACTGTDSQGQRFFALEQSRQLNQASTNAMNTAGTAMGEALKPTEIETSDKHVKFECLLVKIQNLQKIVAKLSELKPVPVVHAVPVDTTADQPSAPTKNWF